MRGQIVRKLIRKDLRDLLKNASILPIVLMAPFLAFIMSKLEQGPSDMMLPIWINYALAMVGVMIPGFLTAEEKEKGTLDSLLVSPAKHNEIILGKVIFALAIIIIDVLLVLIPNSGLIGNQLMVWVGIILGSIFFIQVGLIIGLFTNSQVAAGALSSPAMLFFFLTPMFSGVLPNIFKVMIEYMPSLAVMEIVRGGLLTSPLNNFFPEFITLIAWNIVAFYFTHLGIRRQFQ